MNDPKIEESNEHCLGRIQDFVNSIENSFHMKIDVTLHGPKFTNH